MLKLRTGIPPRENCISTNNMSPSIIFLLKETEYNKMAKLPRLLTGRYFHSQKQFVGDAELKGICDDSYEIDEIEGWIFSKELENFLVFPPEESS